MPLIKSKPGNDQISGFDSVTELSSSTSVLKIRQSEEVVRFSSVAPAPSKDFLTMTVHGNEDEYHCILDVVPISATNITRRSSNCILPSTSVSTIDNVRASKATRDDICRIFGEDALAKVLALSPESE
ncbi:Oidioi.mRNA.OKI2018_I69.XSR.g16943.t2.cds [Oikopleura dioica]|uniref:Oidioi.mRNA.OKI2018_I69.XSR.g16943.t2.cds n=1 Tax=Oikopleura dioica TaxID=34765 RepID=A0ABN7SNZ6_OIKDI|nr:Oidioi.mRNA.OKI2018_I69.XSR.g16943.t2.cds [Oikopleura dioica]